MEMADPAYVEIKVGKTKSKFSSVLLLTTPPLV